jgi:hypothetical protein
MLSYFVSHFMIFVDDFDIVLGYFLLCQLFFIFVSYFMILSVLVRHS